MGGGFLLLIDPFATDLLIYNNMTAPILVEHVVVCLFATIDALVRVRDGDDFVRVMGNDNVRGTTGKGDDRREFPSGTRF
mgnify:CR=1 FL=1